MMLPLNTKPILIESARTRKGYQGEALDCSLVDAVGSPAAIVEATRWRIGFAVSNFQAISVDGQRGSNFAVKPSVPKGLGHADR